MEEREAEGQLDTLPALAAGLVSLPVDIIAAGGEASIRAARQATDKIPIVMLIIDDPIGSELVGSLARPGGKLTGLSTLASDMGSKRVELLKEVVPRALRVAVLWNSASPAKAAEGKETEHAAKMAGIELHSVEVQTPAELDVAFASILRQRPDAMITFTESLAISYREKIGHFAVANRLPMIAELREFSLVGGLASYGISRPDLWRRGASFVDKIVRGANPGDLPVEQPTRFEMVINVKTAKAIGLDVPQIMLARADRSSSRLGFCKRMLLHLLTTDYVKVFGCRPSPNAATHSGGRRTKTSKGRNRDLGTPCGPRRATRSAMGIWAVDGPR